MDRSFSPCEQVSSIISYKLVYLYPANVYQGDSRMFRDFLVVNANTGKEAIKVGEKALIQKYDGAKIVDIKRL